MERKNSVETIKKEMKRYGVDYDTLKPRTKELLIEVEEFMKSKSNENKKIINNYFRYNYSVSNICKDMHIARQPLYQKHPEVIKYINARQEYYKTKDERLCKKILGDADSDKQMIAKMVKRDVEYMELKQLVAEQEKIIKRDKEELVRLKKEISKLKNNKVNNDKLINKNNINLS